VCVCGGGEVGQTWVGCVCGCEVGQRWVGCVCAVVRWVRRGSGVCVCSCEVGQTWVGCVCVRL